ncbi:MAG: lipoyl synthase, partial [Euryarchaeota archaeon]|nr:lipoyl synthase [Euryarchaeota archaeon]
MARQTTVDEKPPWLRVRAPCPETFGKVREVVSALGLKTVCDASHCPNISECWSRRAATFMILGSVCTRKCAFCAVVHGDPEGRVDRTEPARV